jgi:hypothetical protein
MAANSFFRREQITAIQGVSKAFARTGDSGRWVKNYFCPDCGSTVHYEAEGIPGVTGVPIGGFADAAFPAPTFLVFEESKHPWLLIPEHVTAYRRARV